MRKLFLSLGLALSLSACGAGTLGPVLSSPAPLQRVVIDDRAISYALQSYDAMLTLVDAGIKAKIFVPGTPRANAIANALIRVKYWLQVASSAQKAGSNASYLEAFRQAKLALSLAQTALAAN